jgi:hypothetical protein
MGIFTTIINYSNQYVIIKFMQWKVISTSHIAVFVSYPTY